MSHYIVMRHLCSIMSLMRMRWCLRVGNNRATKTVLNTYIHIEK
jgi:hypothetical protein